MSEDYVRIVGGCQDGQVWKNAPCMEDHCAITYYNFKSATVYPVKEENIYYRGLNSYPNFFNNYTSGLNTQCLSCVAYDAMYHPSWGQGCDFNDYAAWSYMTTAYYDNESECTASYSKDRPTFK